MIFPCIKCKIHKYEVLKRPNMCYIFEKLVVQGYQLWSSYHHIIISSHHHIITSSYQFDGAYRRPMDAIFDNWINGMNILNSTLSWWYVFLVSTLTIANHSKNLPGHFCVQHVNQLWASLHQPQAPQPSFCSAKVWNIPCDCFYE